MRYKIKCYEFINIAVIILSFLFFCNLILENKDTVNDISFTGYKIWIWILVVIIFCIIHSIKLIRFYLILLEEKLNFKRFVRVYIKTTFVNIVLPFKSGEIFRFYCYSKEISNYKMGFMSILVERFLDTCALLLFILPFEILISKRLSNLTYLLLVFVILGFIIYSIFPPTYKYINKLLILNIKSKKSLKILECLEYTNEWYAYIKKLINGRFLLVFFLSFSAWIMEYLFVFLLLKVLDMKFLLQKFNIYINSAFTARTDEILQIYTLIGAAVFGMIMLIIYAISFKRGDSVEK